MGKLFGAVKHAAKDFSEDECMVSGAAIAYYTIFALPPLLVIVFFIAGLFGVSQQKIDQVVKEQLGLPATPAAGEQQQVPAGARASGSSSQGSAPVSRVSGSSAVVAEQAATSTLRGPENSPGTPHDQPPPPPLPESTATHGDPEVAGAGADSTAVAAPRPHAGSPHGQTSPPVPRAPAAAPRAQPRSPASRQSAPDQTGASGSNVASNGPAEQPSRSRSTPPTGRNNGQHSSRGGPSAAEQPGGLGTVANRAQSQASPLAGLGPISKIVGILVLVFSATGVLAQLQHALNRAWEVEPDPEQSGIWSFVFKRLLSLGMIVVVAFLLLVSLVLTTLVDELVGLVTGGSSGVWVTVVGVLLNSLVTLALATVLFAAMFKLLPDARMRWKDTWVGAFITALLFVIGKSLLGWYLESSNMGSTWGSAAGSMIALLVWVYYSSLIVLFGAELAQVWANRYGSGIEPAKGAVRIVEEKRHLRGSAA
jgi:membrane protein